MKKLAILLAIGFGGILKGQTTDLPVIRDTTTPLMEPLKLSGPRVGLTYIPNMEDYRLNETFGDTSFQPNNIISQFGWQFEWRYFETQSGSQGLIEIIPMIGGLDQGMILPSLNLIMGYRDGNGFELGAGPNLSMFNPGFTFAVGYNIKRDYMNFPLNFALTSGRQGLRFTLLVGWNKRRG